jgi:hypothetical protein
LASGENLLQLVAIERKTFNHWAGFHQEVIESTRFTSALTITLSWDAPGVELALWVREPPECEDPSSPSCPLDGGQAGYLVTAGDGYRRTDSNPYIEAPIGGPVRYVAELGMTTLFDNCQEASIICTENPNGLYGTYTVSAWYYGDFDEDTTSAQVVPWTLDWRYLAYCEGECADPEADGLWIEGTTSGVMGIPGLFRGNEGPDPITNCCYLDFTDNIDIGYFNQQPTGTTQQVMPP